MVLLDTSFIYAFFNEVDEFHGLARDLLKDVENEPMFVSFLVYQELMTLMMSRFSSEKALLLSDTLFSENSSLQILKMDEEFFEDSKTLFQKLSPHTFSFVDVSLMVLAKHLEAKVLTFDKKLAEAVG
jgi:predicted nucleic acid-binding protein